MPNIENLNFQIWLKKSINRNLFGSFKHIKFSKYFEIRIFVVCQTLNSNFWILSFPKICEFQNNSKTESKLLWFLMQRWTQISLKLVPLTQEIIQKIGDEYFICFIQFFINIQEPTSPKWLHIVTNLVFSLNIFIYRCTSSNQIKCAFFNLMCVIEK